MIRNYVQLAIVREQLTRAENALVSLHQRVYDKNPRNYALYGESYIDMILQLRAEIDEFLKIQPAPGGAVIDDGTGNGATVPAVESVQNGVEAGRTNEEVGQVGP